MKRTNLAFEHSSVVHRRVDEHISRPVINRWGESALLWWLEGSAIRILGNVTSFVIEDATP